MAIPVKQSKIVITIDVDWREYSDINTDEDVIKMIEDKDFVVQLLGENPYTVSPE